MLENKSGKKLKNIQDCFLAALKNESNSIRSSILPIASLSIEECLDIYVQGYSARLTEALGETYPAVWRVLGDDEFFKLSAEYIKQKPSFFFDLSDYGDCFTEFLSNRSSMLSDIARFEWSFKKIFHQKNIEHKTFDLIGLSENIDQLKFRLTEAALLFKSDFPIYEIWQQRDHAEFIEVQDAKGNFLIIYKKNSQIFIKQLKIEEFFLFEKLSVNYSLGDSLQLFCEKFPEINPEFVKEFFTMVGQLGVFHVEV